MENSAKENQSKSRIRPIYFIIMGLVLIVAFTSAFLLGKNLNNAKGYTEEVFTLGPVYSTSEFTVNLAETNGMRYLKTQLSLEVDKKKVLKELGDKLPALEDTIITVLSKQRVSDLDNVDGKENIKKELQKNINKILVNGEVINIYFNHFVWQ